MNYRYRKALKPLAEALVEAVPRSTFRAVNSASS